MLDVIMCPKSGCLFWIRFLMRTRNRELNLGRGLRYSSVPPLHVLDKRNMPRYAPTRTEWNIAEFPSHAGISCIAPDSFKIITSRIAAFGSSCGDTSVSKPVVNMIDMRVRRIRCPWLTPSSTHSHAGISLVRASCNSNSAFWAKQRSAHVRFVKYIRTYIRVSEKKLDPLLFHDIFALIVTNCSKISRSTYEDVACFEYGINVCDSLAILC